MKRINLYLTLLTANAILVTLERFSFTTKIVLQPYNYLRLHELLQMTVIILLSVILPFFLLKEITGNFSTMKTKTGTIIATVFLIGVYFYVTGNGVHEVTNYLFNTFCDTENITTKSCGSLYFNSFYIGNSLFFLGLLVNTVSLILFERMRPVKNFTRKDIIITIANAVIYGILLFAYATFDTVLIGLIFAIITAVITNYLLFSAGKKLTTLPFTLYCTVAYTIASIGAIIIRFFK